MSANVPSLIGHPLQLGGIRTGTLDHPQPMGSRACRVALVDTGSGLRFTVMLDRGGDVADAVFNDCPLAYLTPNGIVPPDEAHHHGMNWLRSWPGGLVTTCGPLHIGAPRSDDPHAAGLHGHHANTPAAVLAVRNPDPRAGELDMSLELDIRDARMFGPSLRTRRTIRARLGEPVLHIDDEVTNLGDSPAPHHWLYHVNLGAPLLAPGAQVVAPGRIDRRWGAPGWTTATPSHRLPPPLPEHRGSGEDGLIIEPAPGQAGDCHVGVVNHERGVGLSLRFHPDQLPRLALWRHLGPAGCVLGIEPFAGSLLDPPSDRHPAADRPLEPGDSRRYALTIRVLRTPSELSDLADAASHDVTAQTTR